MPPSTLTLKRARKLRRTLTPPEARLWVALRGKALGDARFRRQHPLGPYILDFYCPALKLAVEVDGEGHGHPDQAAHDARRDEWLMGQGVKTLRVAAIEVRDNLDGVMTDIRAAIEGRALSSPM
jgi:very-short-patch-repair endonuclease